MVVFSKLLFLGQVAFFRNCSLRTTGATRKRGYFNNHQYGVLLFGWQVLSGEYCASFDATNRFLSAEFARWATKRSVRKGRWIVVRASVCFHASLSRRYRTVVVRKPGPLCLCSSTIFVNCPVSIRCLTTFRLAAS